MDPNNQASSLLLEVVSCKDVCETNNQAVLDLDRGCYSSALVTMTSAVRKLKIFIGNTEHDEAETISSPGASAECVFCVPFSFKSNANDYENEGALELFQFAFMIATPYIGDFESNADLLSKVVLYNLGKCIHVVYGELLIPQI